MKTNFRKVIAVALALCMIASMGAVSAFAAGPYTDGSYTAKVAFLHESKEQASMCNVLFDHDADITVKDGTASISVYAANPVPAFPDQGADGTVKNVVMTIDGVEYPAVSDITTKPLREFDETNPAFGVEAGKSIATQVLTFNVPADKLDAMATAPAKVGAYVNVVMMTDVIFRLKVTDIVKTVAPEVPQQPTETSSKAMQVTADVAAPAPTYNVTIPEAVTMGTLSAEADNTVAYQVNVNAKNLGTGKVVVSAPAEGTLNSGENTLAYTNSFGTQETGVSAQLDGAFTITAAAVKAAAAGNYTGSTSFAISYYAGK